MKITKNQKEIFNLLTKEFLTVKDIAKRRQISLQAIYKTINKLKKKGLLNWDFKGGFKKSNVPFEGGVEKSIRLHAQEFNIKVLYDSRKYHNHIGKTIYLDQNTIRIYKKSMEVYSSKSFFGKTAQEAKSKSIEYWKWFFQQLQNHLRITFLKDRNTKIKEVKEHYSDCDNELAKKANEDKTPISIKAPEDNKEWAKTDNSLNLNEFETLHPTTAKQDMDTVVKPFFNDLRNNPNLPLPSEMYFFLTELVADRKHHSENIREHITSIITLAEQQKDIGNKITLFGEQITRFVEVLDKLEKKLDQK